MRDKFFKFCLFFFCFFIPKIITIQFYEFSNKAAFNNSYEKLQGVAHSLLPAILFIRVVCYDFVQTSKSKNSGFFLQILNELLGFEYAKKFNAGSFGNSGISLNFKYSSGISGGLKAIDYYSYYQLLFLIQRSVNICSGFLKFINSGVLNSNNNFSAAYKKLFNNWKAVTNIYDLNAPQFKNYLFYKNFFSHSNYCSVVFDNVDLFMSNSQGSLSKILFNSLNSMQNIAENSTLNYKFSIDLDYATAIEIILRQSNGV